MWLMLLYISNNRQHTFGSLAIILGSPLKNCDFCRLSLCISESKYCNVIAPISSKNGICQQRFSKMNSTLVLTRSFSYMSSIIKMFIFWPCTHHCSSKTYTFFHSVIYIFLVFMLTQKCIKNYSFVHFLVFYRMHV